MQLVNWQGAIFGPGSEWFWSMLQFIIVAGSLIGLYRQVRLQSSQGAIQQLASFEQELASERLVRHKLEILIARRKGRAEDAPFAAATAVATFWEKVGYLTRAGHLDRGLLWNGSGIACLIWWATLAPWIRSMRVEGGGAAAFEHFEWLAGVMEQMDRRVGIQIAYDEAFLEATRERGIAACRDQLRVEEALRSVIIAPPVARHRARTGAASPA